MTQEEKSVLRITCNYIRSVNYSTDSCSGQVLGIEDVLTSVYPHLKSLVCVLFSLSSQKKISVFSSFNGQITDERSKTCVVLSCIYISCSTPLLSTTDSLSVGSSARIGKPVSFALIRWSGLRRGLHLGGLRPFHLPYVVSFSKLSFPLHSSM